MWKSKREGEGVTLVRKRQMKEIGMKEAEEAALLTRGPPLAMDPGGAGRAPDPHRAEIELGHGLLGRGAAAAV